jgi:hypothetical protein
MLVRTRWLFRDLTGNTLCAMNLYLHGASTAESPIERADTLATRAGVSRKAVIAIEGDESDTMDYRRSKCWLSLSLGHCRRFFVVRRAASPWVDRRFAPNGN